MKLKTFDKIYIGLCALFFAWGLLFDAFTHANMRYVAITQSREVIEENNIIVENYNKLQALRK